MVIRLGPLANWRMVEGGQGLSMPGGRRSIRLAVNVPGSAGITALDMGTGALTFLGEVRGFEEFYFAVESDVVINVDTAADWYFKTDDGEVTAIQYDNESFTSDMEREPRNYEVERMIYMQEQNAKRRLDQMVASAAARIARMERNDGQAPISAASAKPNAGGAGDGNAGGNAPAAKGADAGSGNAGDSAKSGDKPAAGAPAPAK